MNRLLMSACLAAFAMAGTLPEAVAGETASSGAETVAVKTGSGKTAAARIVVGGQIAQPKASGAKTSKITSKTSSRTISKKNSRISSIPLGTKAAREAEAAEAVSTADEQRQSADAGASEQPADAATADPAAAASQVADASATDTATDPAADPNAEPKAAAPKPLPHMNTGHPQIDALVATQAKANDVPEALIHRVIVRESKYQKDLVGSCGCIGLMQIKLGTARSLGYTGDAQGLHDPNTNLTYGVKYLAGAYRAANGDHDRAIHYFAKGYYEVAKRQRLADNAPFGRPERVHAPLDITPKPLAAAHGSKRVAAMVTKPSTASGSDAKARASAR
jgi:soluble lytic murein transglycosylase-like protein